MKHKRIIRLLLPVLTVLLLLLELLPYGVVLRFAQPEGNVILQTYSYFDLTPWGYATFTPLLTALLSVVLLVLTAAALFRRNPRKVNSSIIAVSLPAAVLSLVPVLTGTFTAVAAAVTACLLLIGGLSLINRGKNKENVNGTDG